MSEREPSGSSRAGLPASTQALAGEVADLLAGYPMPGYAA